jgi:hypothetical protein
MTSEEAYKNAIYAYKCAILIGLETLTSELALYIEKDTGITQAEYFKYELPNSDKAYEIRAVIYFSKFLQYFLDNHLDEKFEEYFDMGSNIVKYVSIKTGIPDTELIEMKD